MAAVHPGALATGSPQKEEEKKNFSKDRHRLLQDGPVGPKHVAANA
jgi:hypothetical protein